MCGKERGQKGRNGVFWSFLNDLFVNIRHEFSKDVNQLETRVTSTIAFSDLQPSGSDTYGLGLYLYQADQSFFLCALLITLLINYTHDTQHIYLPECTLSLNESLMLLMLSYCLHSHSRRLY